MNEFDLEEVKFAETFKKYIVPQLRLLEKQIAKSRDELEGKLIFPAGYEVGLAMYLATFTMKKFVKAMSKIESSRTGKPFKNQVFDEFQKTSEDLLALAQGIAMTVFKDDEKA